jgi:hypothetical protein
MEVKVGSNVSSFLYEKTDIGLAKLAMVDDKTNVS